MGSSNSTPVDEHGCPTPVGSTDYDNVGTAWSGMRWAALGCTGVTALFSLSLIFQHLRRYRAPKEQRQIIRIVFSNAIYATIAFVEIYQYKNARYIDPLGDLYEAFGLCALFLLFIQYAAPSGTFDEQTFAAVKAQEETATNFAWPKISWIFVFQYPIVEALCLVIEESTLATGHFCESSLKPKFGHLWVQIISTVSIGACVLAILKFRGHVKGLLKTKRGLSKIVMFKVVVGVRFIQQWIFSILLSNNDIKTSNEFQYNDLYWGIPAVMTCAEMVLSSAAFWYAFSPSEYSSTAHPEKAMPIWKAIPHALNPTDLIMGMIRIFPLFLHVRESGDLSQWQAAKKQKGASGAMRKGRRAYQSRREQRLPQYEEVPSGMRSPYNPSTSHHLRNMSSGSYGGVDGADRLSPSGMYQSPSGSPPDGARTHLMAHAQAPSQNGIWNGQGYEPYGSSRTPSPGRT